MNDMQIDSKILFERLKQWAEEIAGQWNGDESGLKEDRAHCANEIIEKVDELEKLLKEMKDY